MWGQDTKTKQNSAKKNSKKNKHSAEMRIDNNHKDIHTNGNHTNDFISAIFYYEHINGFGYIKHFIRTKQYKQLLVVSWHFQ